MHAKQSKGFTLIELMVSVVVFAVLAAMAAPSLRDMVERNRLRSATNRVMDVLATARQSAVKSDRNVRVQFGGDLTDWCVGAIQQEDASTGFVLAPPTCTCSTAGSCLVDGSELTAAPDGTGVTAGAVSTNFIFDSKNGTIDDLVPKTIDFYSKTGRFGVQLQVSALGLARACALTGGTLKPMPGYTPC